MYSWYALEVFKSSQEKEMGQKKNVLGTLIVHFQDQPDWTEKCLGD